MELELESRDDLMSIVEYLPLSSSLVVVGSSEPKPSSSSSSESPPSLLFWPCPVVDALKALARGPDHRNVDSGEVLFLAISDIRRSVCPEPLPFSAAHGFSLFFDDFMPRTEAAKWFRDVLPAVANLLLRLPHLLEAHYKNASGRLRLLDSQQPGIVFLSQELIGALLACSLFCLFPNSSRGAKHLPIINFDHLFASLYDSYSEKQENKLKCIIHYFGRICSCMPVGNVSFERKVLPLDQNHQYISYPNSEFWSKSTVSLCPFEVRNSGLIEDQSHEALEVDFANKYFGGGALTRGCVQEEIRFMINPELIVGMLFLPSMADNEAIEILGAERFSNYTGYASSFRFCGNFVDTKDVDSMGRRKTRIIAIDALANPGKRQYGITYLIREVNKAFCGFYDQCKSEHYQRLFQEDGLSELLIGQNGMSKKNILFHKAPSTACGTDKDLGNMSFVSMKKDLLQPVDLQDEIGIATGNWGCGAFGGDPEHKAIIQWLAASQALRPFILYYTFGLEALQTLHQVTEWIISHRWSVGDLWNMLVEYSSQRLKKETEVGFFTWLIPSLSVHDPMILDLPHVS